MFYVFLAYTFVWAALLLYCFYLAARNRRLAREMAALEKAVQRDPQR